MSGACAGATGGLAQLRVHLSPSTWPLHEAPPRGMGISGMGVLSRSTSEEASGEPASQEGQAKAAWPFLSQPQSHTASFLVNSVGYSESVRQVQIQEKGL